MQRRTVQLPELPVCPRRPDGHLFQTKCLPVVFADKLAAIRFAIQASVSTPGCHSSLACSDINHDTAMLDRDDQHLMTRRLGWQTSIRLRRPAGTPFMVATLVVPVIVSGAA